MYSIIHALVATCILGMIDTTKKAGSHLVIFMQHSRSQTGGAGEKNAL